MLWTSVASGSVVGTGAVEVILAGLERGMALIVARFAKLRHFLPAPLHHALAGVSRPALCLSPRS